MRHSNHAGRARRLPIWAAGLFALVVSLLALPARGEDEPRGPFAAAQWSQVSQSVAVRYWLRHPDRAPASLRGRFVAANRAIALAMSGKVTPSASHGGDRKSVV